MRQASHNRIQVRSAILLEPLAYIQAQEGLRDALDSHLKGHDPMPHANAALTAALGLQEPRRGQVLQAVEAVCSAIGVPLQLGFPKPSPQFDARPIGLRTLRLDGDLS